jgi:hypothetical protein
MFFLKINHEKKNKTNFFYDLKTLQEFFILIWYIYFVLKSKARKKNNNKSLTSLFDHM